MVTSSRCNQFSITNMGIVGKKVFRGFQTVQKLLIAITIHGEKKLRRFVRTVYCEHNEIPTDSKKLAAFFSVSALRAHQKSSQSFFSIFQSIFQHFSNYNRNMDGLNN